MSFLDGAKNYIFAGIMIVVGAVKLFIPELEVTILGMDDPGTLISAGIAWALGRDAISKAGAKTGTK